MRESAQVIVGSDPSAGSSHANRCSTLPLTGSPSSKKRYDCSNMLKGSLNARVQGDAGVDVQRDGIWNMGVSEIRGTSWGLIQNWGFRKLPCDGSCCCFLLLRDRGQLAYHA